MSESSLAAGGSPSSSFADRIQLLAKHFHGATEIGRRCGFSESLVRSWRDGKSDPSRARCLVLARVLGVSLVWLMTGEGAMWAGDAIDGTGETLQVDAVTHAAGSLDIGAGASPSFDAQRTSIALRVLCGVIELSSNGCLPGELSGMLERVYDMLGPSGRVIDATAMTEFLRLLASRPVSG
ncbi:transcriptional regulator [Dyella sp.]|uniref:helix-turn-helix domain-containing protein n=1 Tax=Dyella sp. TaxID=1869338 RepID=UPI003F7D57A1